MDNQKFDPELKAGCDNIEAFLITEMEKRRFPGLIVSTTFDSDKREVWFKAEIDVKDRTLVVLGWDNVVDSHAGLVENTKMRILARLEESVSKFR